jgi:dipeptidase D
MARVLWQVNKTVPFQLVGFEGGNLRNAIPRESTALILLDESKTDAFSDASLKAFDFIKNEYKTIDPNTAISIDRSNLDHEAPLDEKSQQALINLLFLIPHGITAMHPEIKELVETSTNLAVIHTHKDKAEIICSTRSSTASALEALRDVISAQSKALGAEAIQEEGYPGWKPNLDSPLLKTMKAIYQDTFDKKPNVAAIHAGLECGIIGEKFEGMDMISFGPTIKFPHSPDEKVEISTVEKFWVFLTKVLEDLT